MYSNIDVIRSNVLVGLTSGRNYQLLPEVGPTVESPSNMLDWRNVNFRLGKIQVSRQYPEKGFLSNWSTIWSVFKEFLNDEQYGVLYLAVLSKKFV